MRIRFSRLPIGYQEVEYIESPSYQYIDTGFTVDSTCIIEYDFQYVSMVGGYNRIFGARNGNGNGLLNQRTTTDSDGGFYLECAVGAWSTSSTDFNKHHMVLDSVNRKLYNNGSVALDGFYIADNVEGTMYLFGTYEGGTNSNVRFFSYSLIKNGSLVQKLIPCYRLSDGVIGMYDVVNNNFLTNQAADTYGPFLKGNDVNLSGKLPTGPRLPYAYQEVEYIESDGNQKVDTGIDRGTTVDVSMNLQITGSAADQTVFGTLGEAITSLNMMVNAHKWQLGAGGWNNLTSDTCNTNRHDIYCHFETGASYLDVDGVRTITSTNSWTPDGSNIVLFQHYNRYQATMKLFDAKLKVDGALVRHFVPCYRKSDDVIGLYDTINGVFYTNSGSGAFTKGNNVSDLYNCKVAGGSSDNNENL